AGQPGPPPAAAGHYHPARAKPWSVPSWRHQPSRRAALQSSAPADPAAAADRPVRPGRAGAGDAAAADRLRQAVRPMAHPRPPPFAPAGPPPPPRPGGHAPLPAVAGPRPPLARLVPEAARRPRTARHGPPPPACLPAPAARAPGPDRAPARAPVGDAAADPL